MKVVLTDKANIRSPKELSELLQKRIALVWNYRISNILQNVILKTMSYHMK